MRWNLGVDAEAKCRQVQLRLCLEDPALKALELDFFLGGIPCFSAGLCGQEPAPAEPLVLTHLGAHHHELRSAPASNADVGVSVQPARGAGRGTKESWVPWTWSP